MSEIVWQDPPPISRSAYDRRGKGRTQRFVADLQQQPGRWAFYRTLSSSSCGSYRENFPEVEWTVRKNPDGGFDLYARWVGAS